MGIVNIRIDERLIHGQVAAVWTRTLHADRIMVIDNGVVKNDIQKAALKMACPQGVKLSILSVKRASENIKSNKYGEERIFVVVKAPGTLCELLEEGVEVSEVIVGNMAKKPGTRSVKDTIYLTEKDENEFKALIEKGVRFTAKQVPQSPDCNFAELL